MKKLELIQIKRIDANFIVVYNNNEEIEYTNYFQGIDADYVNEIPNFVNYEDQRFHKIFESFYYSQHPLEEILEEALENAWDLHCKLFVLTNTGDLPKKNIDIKDVNDYLSMSLWMMENWLIDNIDIEISEMVECLRNKI